jgi:vacuolar-type H+-ATPase subunit B/Vma2
MALEQALDELWKILAEIFDRDEVTISGPLLDRYWPKL